MVHETVCALVATDGVYNIQQSTDDTLERPVTRLRGKKIPTWHWPAISSIRLLFQALDGLAMRGGGPREELQSIVYCIINNQVVRRNEINMRVIQSLTTYILPLLLNTLQIDVRSLGCINLSERGVNTADWASPE